MHAPDIVTRAVTSVERSNGGQMSTLAAPGVRVDYAPILDVSRGIAAGYQAEAYYAEPREIELRAPSLLDVDVDGSLTAAAARLALAACSSLPSNTFLSVPVTARAAASDSVRRALADRDLGGVVLDVVGFTVADASGDLDDALGLYRAAGAKLAVGGRGAAQPELASIVGLKPSIVRLGRDWIRGIDTSDAKRSAVEVVGRLAGQLDAWLLAEGVSTAAELRVLAGLEVPLAQGPFIGSAHRVWPAVELSARTALPDVPGHPDGALRALVQPAHTTTDAVSAAAVLPDATGFDVVVVLDEHRRPTCVLEQDGANDWAVSEVLAVNVDTPLRDVAARAMVRPRASRFAPLACTDDTGRFVGVLRVERLVAHLAEAASGVTH